MKKMMSAIAIAVCVAGPSYAMDSLSQFEWKNRVLLVFGNANDAKLKQQIQVLKVQDQELAAREMVVIQISGEEVHAVYGQVNRIDAAKLRAVANADGRRFQAVLVGKDGSVKLRSSRVIGNVEMFDLIDRMPMRRGNQG